MRTFSLPPPPDARLNAWLDALERRHLASLTSSETARALRALSSCYVERRDKLPSGGALDSAGKRAAYALFYGPLHFLLVRAVLAALPGASLGLRAIDDVGCGTGAAGAAWAVEAGVASVRGFDRNPWVVEEAARTYRAFGIDGRVLRRDISGLALDAAAGTGVVVAYAANELLDEGRSALLASLERAHGRGARVLVVEPIARRALPWWRAWERTVMAAGGRTDEWRFPSVLPARQLSLARAAGLNPRELTARTLYLP